AGTAGVDALRGGLVVLAGERALGPGGAQHGVLLRGELLTPLLLGLAHGVVAAGRLHHHKLLDRRGLHHATPRPPDIARGTRRAEDRPDQSMSRCARCSGRGAEAAKGSCSRLDTALKTTKRLLRGSGEMLPADACMQLESKYSADPAGPVIMSIPCCCASRVTSSSSGVPKGGRYELSDSWWYPSGVSPTQLTKCLCEPGMIIRAPLVS